MKSPTSSDKRLRLFENRWLEKLTVISVGWFLAIWTGVLAWLGYSAWGSVNFVTGTALIGLGWLTLTLFEYVLHRFVFHWTPKNDLLAHFVFLMHGNHHIQPSDKLRSLMPPIVSFPIGCAFAVLFGAVFGPFADWVLIGFLLGYVAYDLTHYAAHQWPMRGALGQKLKRHHMQHHFVREDGNFAVTALFWDSVFGTKITVRDRQNGAQRGEVQAAISNTCEAPEPAE